MLPLLIKIEPPIWALTSAKFTLQSITKEHSSIKVNAILEMFPLLNILRHLKNIKLETVNMGYENLLQLGAAHLTKDCKKQKKRVVPKLKKQEKTI